MATTSAWAVNTPAMASDWADDVEEEEAAVGSLQVCCCAIMPHVTDRYKLTHLGSLIKAADPSSTPLLLLFRHPRPFKRPR